MLMYCYLLFVVSKQLHGVLQYFPLRNVTYLIAFRSHYISRSLQARYDQAGPLYKRALAIREKSLGRDHPDMAEPLNNRAVFLHDQVRAFRIFQEIPCGARLHYRVVLAICRS